MKEKIGERFIEGKSINLDEESIENLESILNKVTDKENAARDKLDNIMEKLMSI